MVRAEAHKDGFKLLHHLNQEFMPKHQTEKVGIGSALESILNWAVGPWVWPKHAWENSKIPPVRLLAFRKLLILTVA